MDNKKNGIPKLRFPGFTGAWEQRKLGEILKERKERSSIGELISVTINNGVVKADSLERKDNSSSDKSNYKVVCKGDIAYNSMRMWQGASGYSPYNGILSPAYTVLIPTEKVDSKFISYMFKKEKMLQQFQKYSQGLTSDTWNLKYPMLKDIPVLFPKIDEQVSIRKHLDNISSLIALHQRKLEHLQEQKKGLLQKMFPKNGETVPEVRFPGFTDAWEQRKLGEYGYFYYGKSAPKWSVVKEGGTPCIRYGELYTKFNSIVDRVYSRTNIDVNKLKLSKGGEVLVPRVGEDPLDFANCAYLPFPNIAIGEMISVFNTKQNPLFMTYYFNSQLRREFAKRVEGGNVSNLYYAYLENIKMSVPKKEEQDKISTFIKDFDTLISLHQRKLDHLELMKKGLLQQMFV